jgi:hypothetical protein
LRTELLQKNTASFQVSGIIMTAWVAGVSISASYNFFFGIPIVIVAPLLLWVIARYLYFNMLHIVERIMKLEETINQIAGSRLLCWETDFGIFSHIRNKRLEYLFDPLRGFWSWVRTRAWPPMSN